MSIFSYLRDGIRNFRDRYFSKEDDELESDFEDAHETFEDAHETFEDAQEDIFKIFKDDIVIEFDFDDEDAILDFDNNIILEFDFDDNDSFLIPRLKDSEDSEEFPFGGSFGINATADSEDLPFEDSEDSEGLPFGGSFDTDATTDSEDLEILFQDPDALGEFIDDLLSGNEPPPPPEFDFDIWAADIMQLIPGLEFHEIALLSDSQIEILDMILSEAEPYFNAPKVDRGSFSSLEEIFKALGDNIELFKIVPILGSDGRLINFVVVEGDDYPYET